MADYVALADLEGRIPTLWVTEALDDDGDGIVDDSAWTAVAADINAAIDGALGGRFTVPFEAPLPAVIVNAARIFACEQLYIRRGKDPDKNPFSGTASAVRKQLADIAAGKQPLEPGKERAKSSGSIVSECAKTHSSYGRLGL